MRYRRVPPAVPKPQLAQEGFEPSASLVLSESGLPVAYRAFYSIPGAGIEPAASKF